MGLLAGLVGCVGLIDQPRGVEDDKSPPSITPTQGVDICVGDRPLLKPQLRRLTAAQYENTIEAVFGPIAPDDLPDFQDDNPTIGLANDPSKLRITNVTIDSIYASARAISANVATQHPTVVACVAATGPTCFETVIDELAPALWRRPISAEERAALLDGIVAVARETATREEQMSFVLQALLMSPNTLFRTEVGDGPGTMAQLSNYELASLLSYTLWDSPPDAELLSLAASGTLREPETLRAQTERMIGDARFLESVAGFFWDYLKLANVQSAPKDEQFGLDATARSALADSARGTIRSKIAADENVMNMFRGQDFEMNAAAASFFGVDGSALSETLTTVNTSPEQREGILTHPAFLSVHAGEGNTGIVKRGVFTLEQLLGNELPDPPDNIMSVDPGELPPFDPATTSTRELLRMTHSDQARCAFCHVVIDPAGFGYENFDPVGRFRVEEKQAVAIDSSGSFMVDREVIEFDNSVDYMKSIANSKAMRRTVLEHYFTYAMGQTGDGCEARRFAEDVADAGDLVRSLAEVIVGTESFAARQAAGE